MITLEFPAWPVFDDAERDGLLRALERGQWWRVTGAEVEELEREFAAANGAPYALAVTNGTHALELALLAHGVGPGDEVVVPAFTFVSTSLAVQRVGAVPVPVDVDPVTYCLTPGTVEPALTERTRAVVPVHMAGHVADLAGLERLAARHGVEIVQDAAHAPGASRSGRLVGSHPSAATYSFQNFKLLTAGEGGAVTFPDEALYERAYLLHTCGRPRGDRVYDHRVGGSNYRMNEFTAAVLRAQLARLADQTKLREAASAYLDELLGSVPGVVPQGRDRECDVHPHYMAMYRVEGHDRDALVDGLVDAGVPAFVDYRPVYRTAGFWQGPAPTDSADAIAERCPNAEALGAHGFWLHHRVLLAEERVLDRLAETVRGLLA